MRPTPSRPRSPRRGHPSLDATGCRVRVGDIVRIVGVPDLSGLSAPALRETRPVFRYLVGRYKRVVGFDAQGRVELFFRIPRGRHRGLHAVWIEPGLVRIRRTRSVAG